MYKKSFLTALGIIIFSCTISYSSNREGGTEFMLYGGNKGNIFFPHKKHQDAAISCNRCHFLFPKQRGKIGEMIKNNKLEKKQVMNHCIKCHREKMENGQKTGPNKCKGCHG